MISLYDALNQRELVSGSVVVNSPYTFHSASGCLISYVQPNRLAILGDFSGCPMPDTGFTHYDFYQDRKFLQTPKLTETENRESTMSESQSRYSIVENLTKQKNEANEQISIRKMNQIQRETAFKRAEEQRARQSETEKENNADALKVDSIAIKFQEEKILQLETAIATISNISKTVEAEKA